MQLDFENILHEKPAKITRLSGGDINEVYEVISSKGVSVFKINDASRFPQMLALEAEGLKLLRASNTIRIPAVLENGIANGNQFLSLEKITVGKATEKTW